MKRRLLILVIVCEMASCGWAINDKPALRYFGEDTGIDAEGNLYYLTTDYESNTHGDFLTIKYNKEGKKLWGRRFNGPVHGYDTSSAITVDGKGNVYVTGRVQLREDVNDRKAFGCATIKYDKDGKELWAALYETSRGKSPSLNSIAVDTKGNVYLTGSDTVKYDDDGKQIWAISDEGAAIKPDLIGNVYAVGSWSGGGTFTIRKYNSYGKLLWDATYSSGELTYSFARALAVDDTGGVWVFGSIWHLDDKYSHLITIKYDSEGRQQWVARYVEPGNKHVYSVSIVKDDEKNVYITGYGTTPGRQEHGFDDNPLPLMIEFVTIKYDSRGKEQRVTKYKGTKRRRGHLNGLGIDRAGNVYVKGYVEHPQFRNIHVGIVIKYDKNGREKWITYFEDISESSKILQPSYSPSPDKIGAKWFETRRAAKKAALLSDIRKSSDLNSKDKHGYSLLGRAASGGYIDIIKMLIDKGAKVTEDAVCAGVWTGQAEAVKILAQVHGNITADTPCMFEALTWLEEPAVVKALLEGGLDANAKDKEGDSLLSWSFDYGHFDIVKLLLDAGADANSRDSFGEPLVHEALRANDIDVVKAFIEAGVSVETKNTSGESLLESAVDEQNIAMVRLLLDAGADANTQAESGEPLIHEAVDSDDIDIVKAFIDAGVSMDTKNTFGETLLERAVREESTGFLKLLLDAGADVKREKQNGAALLFEAIRADNVEMLKLLIGAGVDPSARDKDGSTALHKTVLPSSKQVLSFLLEQGLDINAKDREGRTPLKDAIEYHNQDIAEILRKYGAKE